MRAENDLFLGSNDLIFVWVVEKDFVLCAVCVRQGISGVHPRDSYGDMDLGV